MVLNTNDYPVMVRTGMKLGEVIAISELAFPRADGGLNLGCAMLRVVETEQPEGAKLIYDPGSSKGFAPARRVEGDGAFVAVVSQLSCTEEDTKAIDTDPVQIPGNSENDEANVAQKDLLVYRESAWLPDLAEPREDGEVDVGHVLLATIQPDELRSEDVSQVAEADTAQGRLEDARLLAFENLDESFQFEDEFTLNSIHDRSGMEEKRLDRPVEYRLTEELIYSHDSETRDRQENGRYTIAKTDGVLTENCLTKQTEDTLLVMECVNSLVELGEVEKTCRKGFLAQLKAKITKPKTCDQQQDLPEAEDYKVGRATYDKLWDPVRAEPGMDGQSFDAVKEAKRSAALKWNETVGLPEFLVPLYEGIDPKATEAQKRLAVKCILKNQNCFAWGAEDMERVNCAEHLIDLKEGSNTSSVRFRPRRFSPVQNQDCKRITDDLLAQGLIHRSDSTYASPVVLVKKKNGSTRLCVDYRALNQLTEPNNFPLPRIDTILDSLTGKRWFATLDLQSGYWQIPIKEEDKTKTAFVTQDGLFEWQRMPFGLKNAPASFMKVMNFVMGRVDPMIALAYLDDVIIGGATFEELLKNIDVVLNEFMKAKMKFGVAKCKLFQKRVEFLGHVLTEDGIAVNPEKIKTVKEWVVPKNRKDVRSFLGFCNYYRRFVPSFSELAVGLTCLVSDYVVWTWGEAQEKSFQALKNALADTIILAYPDPQAHMILDTDASDFGIGAVLSQIVTKGGQAVEEPVSFWSKTLSGAERRYCTTRKELLAVVRGIEAHRTYLHGRHFIVRSDHTALRYIIEKTTQFTDPVVVRLLEKLTPYDFEFAYRAGELHANADGASRSGVCTEPCKWCEEKINHRFDKFTDAYEDDDGLIAVDDSGRFSFCSRA